MPLDLGVVGALARAGLEPEGDTEREKGEGHDADYDAEEALPSLAPVLGRLRLLRCGSSFRGSWRTAASGFI